MRVASRATKNAAIAHAIPITKNAVTSTTPMLSRATADRRATRSGGVYVAGTREYASENFCGVYASGRCVTVSWSMYGFAATGV